VGAGWGSSVGFDVACGRGWEVRWLRTAPQMRYRGTGELEEEIKFVLESVTVKRPPKMSSSER